MHRLTASQLVSDNLSQIMQRRWYKNGVVFSLDYKFTTKANPIRSTGLLAFTSYNKFFGFYK
jgi:hypothetical protein